MNKEIAIGSRVRVTDPLNTYSGYKAMAERMGIEEVWTKYTHLKRDDVAFVIRIEDHCFEERKVYALQTEDGRVVIMNDKGFEKIGDVGKFAIGSKVKVTNSGYTYDTYNTMAEAMGVTDKWKSGRMSHNGEVGVVVAAMMHESAYQGVVYALEINDNVVLVGEKGLEQYVEPKLAKQGSTFPVGTKVRVRHDVAEGREDSKIEEGVSESVVKAMLSYAGREGVIQSSGRGGYQLDITHWNWLPDWLELVPELTPEQRIEELEAQLEILRAEKAEIAGKLWLAESKLTRIADIAK